MSDGREPADDRVRRAVIELLDIDFVESGRAASGVRSRPTSGTTSHGDSCMAASTPPLRRSPLSARMRRSRTVASKRWESAT
jgi:hypothetical protein